MTVFTKSTAAALAIAVLSTSGIFAGSANASPMIRLAVTDTAGADVIKIGGFHHKKHKKHKKFHGGHGHYGYYYGDCFWKKRRIWDPYYGGYHWKRVRICY
jgi:hypothetical protein